MNYPIWHVPFGAGLVVAVVSIVHVFVSHFAVGGGLYLVLTEAKAYRDKNDALLEWVKVHSRFFVLLTVVFGALSGVGIWFTIGLVSPSATSSLIHTFLWGWAMEWVFFFLEITSALLYLYLWGRVSRKTHLWLGWVYFVTAYMSLVIINGIITYMLTPGDWLETRGFWDGFFNPTYFPSLLFRTLIAAALAGIYALLTVTIRADGQLRAQVIRWSARWTLPALVLLPLAGTWYTRAVPAPVWDLAQGRMPTASQFLLLLTLATAGAFVLFLLTLVRPRKTPFLLGLGVAIAAFLAMGSFEFIREAVRKPYVIYDYLYANALYKESAPGTYDQKGVLATARWSRIREIGPDNRIEAGHEVFYLECLACHTVDAYRGLRKVIAEKGWDGPAIEARIPALHKMVGGVMPPFAGTNEEVKALAAFLASLNPKAGETKAPVLDGKAVFDAFCLDCHELDREDILFESSRGLSVEAIDARIADLPALDDLMPPFSGTEAERQALSRWIHDWIGEGER